MKSLTRGLLKAVTVLMFTVSTCFAQFSGSIQGTIQDPTGAAIPKVTVTLTNTDTKVSQNAISDAEGNYRFVSLAPGPYLLTVDSTGFASAKTEVTLTTAETRSVPIQLAVAGGSTNVTVTAQAPLIDTSDSRLEQTLNNQALQTLPLAARNPTALLGLTPGVTGKGTGNSYNFNPENYIDVSANGRGQNGNQYVVDGLDVTSSIRPGVLNLTPNVDAVAEVSIQTNTYTVDYGRASSIQTMMTTKSGTDQYHGFASEYYNYQGLNARGEFGVPQPNKVNPYHVNNMSFGAGGPVWPKKRFFFFASYEPYLALSSNGGSVQTYEDPAFVSFAQAAQPDSPEVQLMTNYKPTGATTTGVAATALQVFGVQNVEANTGCNTPSTDNIPCETPVFDHGNFNSSSYNNAKQWNVRIDKYFDKDRIYGNFIRNTISQGGPAIRPAFATTNEYYGASIQINETHTFSPNMLNEASFGYNRIEGFVNQGGNYTVPIVSVTQLGVGFGIGFAQGDYIQHSYHWRDVLTKVHGTHSIKIGYEGWHGDDLALFAGAYGIPSLSYNNMIDLINDKPYTESGLSYNIVTGQPQPGQYQFAMTTNGLFAQDTWKAARNLTVNYGLRYDNFGNPYPTGGTTLANFNLPSSSNLQTQVTNGVMKVQSNVYNSSLNWVFSPRVGVAWDPVGDGKWVVRGGIGLYHDFVTLGNAENGLKGNPPGFVVPTFKNDGSTAPPIFGYGKQDKYPYGFEYPAFVGTPLDEKGGVVGSNISVGGVDVHISSPHTLNWSGSVDRQLTRDIVGTVGYIGSHSGNLIIGGGNTGATSYGVDVNVYSGDLLQHLQCTEDPTTNSCNGVQTRLNTSFGSITYATNGARANYNAFIAAVKGRWGQRGFLTASYTYSQSKDDWQGYPGVYPYDQYYGPSNWNAPNRFALGWNYEIPGATHSNGFVKAVSSGWGLSGATILQSGNPFTVYTGAAFHGTLIDQGSPASPTNVALAGDSGDFNADGDNFDYPNVTNYHQKNDRDSFKSGNGVFPHCPNGNLDNCGPFTLPAPGVEGNEKTNQFQGPGYSQTDLAVKKITPITERFALEIRADFINGFNRVNLNGAGQGLDTNAQDGTNFGTTNSTQTPRNIILGARLTF
jgi:Carboxypeptidase regulatory-like domain/TonB-dependent Receptor Plug Domain